VGKLSPTSKEGDQDPMDICVISERPISQNEIILNARVIGGFQMVDKLQADDKIVAVLANDDSWCDLREIDELPHALVDRLRHYFLTYKLRPGGDNQIDIYQTYGREHAQRVIQASIEDYQERYGQDKKP
jgi:inorganic pyrophosphatase